MSAESLAELRKWFDEHKNDLETTLAIKHRNKMAPGVADALKEACPDPDASDEERELGLILALTLIADKLDLAETLVANAKLEFVEPTVTPAPPSTRPELVPAAHVDVAPLGPVPPHDDPPKASA